MQFFSPVIERILAMEDLRGWLSLLSEAIDSTDGLALLIEGPKLLQNNDMVCCNKIQPSRSESWGEDESGRGLDV